MDPILLGAGIAIIGALTLAAALAILLHTARREARLLEANDAGLRSTIATLEARAIERALDTVKLETDKTVERLPGETLDAFGRRTDLEAMKGRDSILSAVLASGHIHEEIEINMAANTADIRHALRLVKATK